MLAHCSDHARHVGRFGDDAELPASRSSSVRSPSRTMAWSSAMITSIGRCQLERRRPSHGTPSESAGPIAWPKVERESGGRGGAPAERRLRSDRADKQHAARLSTRCGARRTRRPSLAWRRGVALRLSPSAPPDHRGVPDQPPRDVDGHGRALLAVFDHTDSALALSATLIAAGQSSRRRGSRRSSPAWRPPANGGS